MKVALPKGTKYLDLRDQDDKELPVSPMLHRQFVCSLSIRDRGPSINWNPAQIGQVLEWIGNEADPKNATVKVNELLSLATGREALGRLYHKFGIQFWTMKFGSHSFAPCRVASKIKDSSLQMVFVNPEVVEHSKAQLLVQELESALSLEKRSLYADAISYFEAFDVRDCAKLATNPTPALCGENESDRTAFWKLYRSWATVLYGLDPNISQLDLEAYRLKKSESMSDDQRKKITESTFGCKAGDFP